MRLILYTIFKLQISGCGVLFYDANEIALFYLQVSSSGGWCRDAANPANGEHKTDFLLAKALANLFKGKSVASFGDGPGLYRKVRVFITNQ